MAEQSGVVKLELPWPPSINTYWRRNGARYFISSKGMNFRKEVILLAINYREKFSKNDRLKVTIEAYPPDKRRRDLDNIFKGIFDSLQHAGVYDDDSQIDDIHIIRMPSLESKVSIIIQSI